MRSLLAQFKVGDTTVEAPSGLSKITPQAAGPFGQNIIRLAIELLFFGAIILCLVYIILGGIRWMMSGGDPKAVEAARHRIVYAIIGLVLVFTSFFILNLISYFFRINLLGFTDTTVIETPGGPH